MTTASFAGASPPGGASEDGPRSASAAPQSGAATVVLIGRAADEPELASVLRELLDREGVSVEFARKPAFRASAFLAESAGDPRVWVFVTANGPHEARLYFRGPFGEKFLVRRLVLRSGLDELGRELIGQVVESSAIALLRSEAGVSRAEAEAVLTAEDDPLASVEEPIAPTADAARATRPSATSSEVLGRLELGAAVRGFASYSGSAFGVDHGVGLEALCGGYVAPRFFLRGRIVGEQSIGQSLETGGFHAELRTRALRGGLDAGTSMGASAWVASLLGGIDGTRISPDASREGFVVAGASSSITPMIRLELRYELAVGAFRLAIGGLGDVRLADTHYDVRDGSGVRRAAEPLPVRPGAFLTLGVRLFP